jgi:hypothetical protein
MINYKKYFHDRFVLLMLTINSFLALFITASILLRLGDTSDVYIKSYRENLGLNGYEAGGLGQILSFIIFAGFILIMQFALSLRIYHLRKQVAWAVMILGGVLLLLSLIVSNALLELR